MLNHTLHLIAITQLRYPTTEGRAFHERTATDGCHAPGSLSAEVASSPLDQSAPTRSRCRTAIHPGRTGSQKVANR